MELSADAADRIFAPFDYSKIVATGNKANRDGVQVLLLSSRVLNVHVRAWSFFCSLKNNIFRFFFIYLFVHFFSGFGLNTGILRVHVYFDSLFSMILKDSCFCLFFF